MAPSRLALAAALLCLAACEREATRILNQRRAAVSARLDRVQHLRPALAAVLPITEPSLTLGPTPLSFTGLPTATVVYEHALADLRVLNEASPHYRTRIPQAQLLEDCGELLRRGAEDAIPAVAQSRLDSCINIEYVFILRTRTFTDHDFEGDVVAFSLTTGRAIGGFPLAFTSASRTGPVTSNSYTTVPRRRGRMPSVTKHTTTRTVNTDSQQVRFDLADAIEAEIKRLARPRRASLFTWSLSAPPPPLTFPRSSPTSKASPTTKISPMPASPPKIRSAKPSSAPAPTPK